MEAKPIVDVLVGLAHDGGKDQGGEGTDIIYSGFISCPVRIFQMR